MLPLTRYLFLCWILCNGELIWQPHDSRLQLCLGGDAEYSFQMHIAWPQLVSATRALAESGSTSCQVWVVQMGILERRWCLLLPEQYPGVCCAVRRYRVVFRFLRRVVQSSSEGLVLSQPMSGGR
jgi:hypothetical protein